MTKKEENYALDLLERIRDETHENNIMLKQICRVINTYIKNHDNENKNDFERNVLANIFSNIINIKGFKIK